MTGKEETRELLCLNRTAEECMAELDSAGIPYRRPASVSINTRAKKRWGQCRMENGRFAISISKRLLVPGREEALRQVLIHELLHTCEGCMNHGPRWKYYAELVHRRLGYTIRRTTSPAELGLSGPEENAAGSVRKPEAYKHRFVCEGCGAVIMRKRESNFTRHYQNYRCARCGGKFRKEY